MVKTVATRSQRVLEVLENEVNGIVRWMEKKGVGDAAATDEMFLNRVEGCWTSLAGRCDDWRRGR